MRSLIFRTLGFAAAALLGVQAGEAQTVYKWKDANGQVHYSQRKDDAGPGVQELKIEPPRAVPTAPMPPPPTNPAFNWGPQPQPAWTEPSRRAPAPPRSVSGGRDNGTDASRCALARDILNGSLRHRNGNPIDQYDRDVAKADIERFCH
jgi:hypothetical protein